MCFRVFPTRSKSPSGWGFFSQPRVERIMRKLRLKYENDHVLRCEVFTAHWWTVCSGDGSQLVSVWMWADAKEPCGSPPPLSLLLSTVFTVLGMKKKGPRLARTEGACVGQLWFLPLLHHLDHSLRLCPDQRGLSRSSDQSLWGESLGKKRCLSLHRQRADGAAARRTEWWERCRTWHQQGRLI